MPAVQEQGETSQRGVIDNFLRRTPYTFYGSSSTANNRNSANDQPSGLPQQTGQGSDALFQPSGHGTMVGPAAETLSGISQLTTETQDQYPENAGEAASVMADSEEETMTTTDSDDDSRTESYSDIEADLNRLQHPPGRKHNNNAADRLPTRRLLVSTLSELTHY